MDITAHLQPSHSRKLRVLLMGKTGSGVSSSGNTVMGYEAFRSGRSLKSITRKCQQHTAEVLNQSITVIDTPSFFNSENADVSVEIKRGFKLCSPGPHVLLLVFSLSTFTQQDAEIVSLYKRTFGEHAMKYTFVIFTHGDELQINQFHKSIQQLIQHNRELSKLIDECSGRFHLLNNEDQSNREQVTELLDKIHRMVSENDNSCFTLKMFLKAQTRDYLLRFLRPGCLYTLSVIALFMGCANMLNEGSLDVKTILYSCVGGVLAAVAVASTHCKL